jgi:hypothetical protein
MIEEIALERAGGQDLLARLTRLNACALNAARKLALNPNSPSRLRIAAESLASYRDLSEIEVGHFAGHPMFVFRPSRIVEALSHPPVSGAPPDGELLRRFLLVMRDLASHGPVFPVAILGVDPQDVEKARRFTDDDFEVLHGSSGLTFEPRIEPVERLRSRIADGWAEDPLMAEILRELNRLRIKSQKATPKGTK